MKVSTLLNKIKPCKLMPVLSTIKVETKDNKVILTKTDLENTIILSMHCISDKDSCFLVDAKQLEKALSKKELLRIENNSFIFENITIKAIESDKTSYKDFPSSPSPQDGVTFTCPSVINGFKACKHAVSTDATRYHLNGYSFNGQEIVATDGHRLARYELARDSLYDNKVIIPSLLGDVIGACGEFLVIYDKFAGTKICNTDKKNPYTAVMYSKLIVGNYPDYNRVIPDNNSIKFDLDKDNITKTIEGIKDILCFKTNNSMPGTVTLSGSIKLVSGKVESIIDFDTGLKNDINFNIVYFREALKEIENNATLSFKMEFKDALEDTKPSNCNLSPCRIDEGPLTMVLIPMRV